MKKIKIIMSLSIALLFILLGVSFFLNNPIKSSLRIEAGYDLKETDFYKIPKLYEFLSKNHIPLINCKLVTEFEDKQFKPGEYSIQFLVNGKIQTTKFTVEDTINPVLTAKKGIILRGERLSKKALNIRVEDATRVKIKLISDYKGKPGKYNVKIVATDLGKNKSTTETELYVLDIKRKLKVELGDRVNLRDFLNKKDENIRLSTNSKLDIKKTGKYTFPVKVMFGKITGNIDLTLDVVDTKPPVINGVRDIEYFMGEDISYREGVYALDNNKEISVKVDGTRVNLKKEGVYKIFYTAVDDAENKTVKTAEITVKKSGSHAKQVTNYVKEVLEGTAKKSIIEKLEKIYDFCHAIQYIGYSDKGNVLEAAYSGFKTGRGDCFTYFATAKVLIDSIGLENKMIQRNSKSNHFWNLIKYDGRWYHFDTCPIVGSDGFKNFMKGNSELSEFSKKYGEKFPENKGYYKFNSRLYPEISEKGLNMEVK